MSNEDILRGRGTPASYKDNRGGAVLIPHPVIGIVKNNIDPTRSGRIQVFLDRLNSSEQDNPNNWTSVSYLSPFFGYTQNTSSKDGEGEYTSNPHSYGFWATPPDIGTEVICVFINGQSDFGYYIGSIPKPGMTHMVPAIGSSDSTVSNKGEAGSYGGATRLPVTEINNANKDKDGKSTLAYQARTVHSYQAAILNKQGLLRDPIRGTIGSSAVRESPSRVFGMSTPGRPIYKGGYTDETIKDAIKDKDSPDENYKVIGRRGGHSIVLDDGDLTGKDQLVRIRTSLGHQIMMHDKEQILSIIHANGQSWIELGKEGTIDLYSTNSVNIRTHGDLNMHADRDINLHAAKNLNIAAENINLETTKAASFKIGTDFKNYVMGKFTLKVDDAMSFASKGEASVVSQATTYINGGPNVMLNSGTASLVPEVVKSIPIVAHTDTLYDGSVGYAPAPGKLNSITSRAPAHGPWASANQGVDVKTDLGASANLPPAPSPETQAANTEAGAAPKQPASPAQASTAPPVSPIGGGMDKAATSAAISQAAVNAAAGPAAAAVAAGAGVVNIDGAQVAALGKFAANPTQMCEAGTLKPGTDIAIAKSLALGKSIEQSIPANFFTGKNGVNNLSAYVQSPAVQAMDQVDLMKKGQDALTASGALTGKEAPAQQAGLLLAAAAAGPAAVAGFLKDPAGAAGKLTSAAGPLKDLVSSGNFSANLAEKGMGGLTSLAGVADALKGVAAGAFAKITGAFKPLAAGVPQNLTAIKAAADEAQAAADAKPSGLPAVPSIASLTSVAGSLPAGLDKLPTAASLAGVSIPGLGSVAALVTAASSSVGALPGGMGAIAKMVDFKNPTAFPADLAGLKDKLSKGGDSLMAAAGTGLGAGDAAKLAASINSMGSGAVQIKMPTVAENTTNIADQAKQAASLLGNPKIPALSFGPAAPFKMPTAEQSKKYDELNAKVNTLTDEGFVLRKKWLDVQGKLGPDAPESIAANSAYKANVQAIEATRQEIATAVS